VVRAAASDGGESLAADITYTDEHGRLLAVLEGLQCACTKTLNRLGGSAARRLDGGDLEVTRQQEGVR
jgi:hypothetical protein